ncbi:hypothetical protein LTR95_017469, partial [Oleoguttula sp. CCFEE 5521]
MDWTGGTRRRYATTKNNAVAQKQKAHFAKARAHLPPGDSPGQAVQWRILSIVDPNGRQRPTSQSQSSSAHPGRPEVNGRERQRSDYLSQTVRHQPNRSVGESEMAHAEHHADVGAAVHADSRASRSASRDDDPHARVVKDEEMLLLTNRRKLLAQSDWLELAATKPLRMRFPVAGERDRIGRRRKLSKSGSQRAKPAQRRLVTPIFEDRLPLLEPYMSGALLDDDNRIKIKIGTDAFASQTAASPVSSEAGDVQCCSATKRQYAQSEDSMLLGMDGDVFDADQVKGPQRFTKRARADLGGSVYAQAGSQMAVPRFTGLIRSIANSQDISQGRGEVTQVLHSTSAFEQQSQVTQSQPLHFQDSNPNEVVPHDPLQSIVAGVLQLQSELQDHPHIDSRTQDGESSDDAPWRKMLGIPSRHNDAASRLAMASSSEHIATSITEARPHVPEALQPPTSLEISNSPKTSSVDSVPETSWQDLLGFRKAHLSQLSGRALHSDSCHEDTSSSTRLAGHQELNVRIPYKGESLSTPYGAGTPATMHRMRASRRENLDASDTALCQSPSASLQHIRALAALPISRAPAVAKVPFIANDDDADAIWWRFIVGSQSSDGSSQWDQGGGTRPSNAYDEALKPIPSSNYTPIAISGQQQAKSLFVTGRTSSVAPLGNEELIEAPDL